MSKAVNMSAFVCPNCKRAYGDGLYHGPIGHAPQNLCLDCWANEWAQMEVRMLNGGDWSVLDSALWLICCGFTRQEAAGIIGVGRRTIHRWIQAVRKDPEKIPQWLSQNASLVHHYS